MCPTSVIYTHTSIIQTGHVYVVILQDTAVGPYVSGNDTKNYTLHQLSFPKGFVGGTAMFYFLSVCGCFNLKNIFQNYIIFFFKIYSEL